MAQFVKTFYQELNNKKRTIRHCEDVCFTGDNLSDMIGVYLTVDGQPYTGGGTVSGTVINSRGQTVPITTGAISGNLVTVTLEQGALAVPGLIGVYVKLTTGTTVATVLAAKFTVEQTETDTPIDPGTVISSVDALITRINTAVESIPADYSELLAGVAPSFSSSTAYTAGQYVWYPGLVDNVGALYRFTADHAAGSWTGTDAVSVSLAGDLGAQVAELKSALTGVSDSLYLNNINIIWYQGSIKTNGTNNTTTTACRTDMIALGEYPVAIIKPDDWLYYIVEYASNTIDSFTKIITPVYSSGNYVFAPVSGYYYRIVVKKADGSDFTPSDAELTNFSLDVSKSTNEIIQDESKRTENLFESVCAVVPDLVSVGTVQKQYSYDANNSNSTNQYNYPVVLQNINGFVKRIRLNVLHIGDLKIGCYKKSGLGVGSPFIESDWLYLTSIHSDVLGDQTIEFAQPIYVPDGYALAIGRLNDTLMFAYGTDGIDKSYYYRRNTQNDWNLSSTNSCGLDIYCIDVPNDTNNIIPTLYTIGEKAQREIYNGWDERNTSSLSIGACPIMPLPLITNAVITGIKANILASGILSIGVYESSIVAGETFDESKYKRAFLLNISETGEQTINFPEPLLIYPGSYLAIGRTSDTAIFAYGSYGYNKTYIYPNASTRIFTKSATRSLGVIIYGDSLRITADPKSVFAGKKLSIYGDSISTFARWIPQGNAVYYTGNNCDVLYVDDTWWMKTIKALQFDLLVNNSWSGRAVSSVRDGSTAHATDAGYKQANIDQLKTGDILPDVIIIKLGINDFNNECPLGTYDGKTAIPTDPTAFSDAYAIMLDRIMTTYPLADVYCCTLMPCEKNGAIGFPETNGNGNTIDEFNEVIKNLASAFGAKVLNHHTCGITYYNLSTYMGDYSASTQQGLHPNPAGHSLIANTTINEMDNAIRIRY